MADSVWTCATRARLRIRSKDNGLFGCRRIAAVELVHHRGDPAGDEHLRGAGRAIDHPRRLVRLVLLELRQLVIREVTPRVSAPDPQPQPGELVADVLDDRLQ